MPRKTCRDSQTNPFCLFYYWPDGKVEHEEYGNGVRTDLSYDGRGMIAWLHHYRVSPYQNLAWREYTRDARDRIISWKAGGDNSVNPMQDGRGHRFAYDAEGQLTDAWYGPYDPANSTDGTVREDHFSYDALGNRRLSNWQGGDGAINYVRKDDTHLNQYRSWLPYGIINYDDDFGPPWGSPHAANGVVMQDGYITASYNALNQPRAIWAPAFGSNYLWLGYDPLGRCVKRWVGPGDGSAPGGLRFFYYDGWNLLEDGSNPWNPEHAYVNGARVDEIAASYTWGVPSYHHYDANGNCMTLTNAAGNITEQYYYDAFGKPYMYDGAGNSLSASPSGNRFLFTGREYISELKLYDYRNRLYNPQMGRFLQPDPKEFAAGDYNLYRYCHNDPINKSDPFGLVNLSYTPDTSDFAEERKWEPTYTRSDAYTVAGHGDVFGLQDRAGGLVPVSDLATRILADKNYTPGRNVFLIICEAGRGENSLVRRLAKELAQRTHKETTVYGCTTDVKPGDAPGSPPQVMPEKYNDWKSNPAHKYIRGTKGEIIGYKGVPPENKKK